MSKRNGVTYRLRVISIHTYTSLDISMLRNVSKIIIVVIEFWNLYGIDCVMWLP